MLYFINAMTFCIHQQVDQFQSVFSSGFGRELASSEAVERIQAQDSEKAYE